MSLLTDRNICLVSYPFIVIEHFSLSDSGIEACQFHYRANRIA